ncbi:arsenate reductase (glutaredoxin) [Acinetobacter bereziniae]|uniref:arsenate reductase (glutaredoxin) n=1 Tax=Acinetobacter bereziniae TaxID=106648 RepID=UPI001117605F|nr:arsenate reductase (glutaredoxin) [Acinetobacter bereziniae]TNL52565.1 arsenate reductase (glutaredoxin) [Acinetobacter bereziniae]TNL63490.1 arsenate reductase (glutaredoxin) [Acinetobacter bereziniae]
MSSQIKIYHNPDCGTSRNTLALIRNAGIEPEIIEYLNHPPSKQQLIQLIQRSGLSIKDVLRKNVEVYTVLNLERQQYNDDQLIELMLQHPILINRPFVVTELGVRLCRPSELVLDILSAPQLHSFSKEDGEIIINQALKRVK